MIHCTLFTLSAPNRFGKVTLVPKISISQEYLWSFYVRNTLSVLIDKSSSNRVSTLALLKLSLATLLNSGIFFFASDMNVTLMTL